MLNVWVNPWATNLALYLSTKPSKFNFTMKTHLRPIVVFPAGNASTLQVWFFLRALISSSIASFHFGTFRAFCTLLGISTLDNWKVKATRDEKNFDYDINLENRWLVQDLIPLRRVIGMSKLENLDWRLGSERELHVPDSNCWFVLGSKSWLCYRVNSSFLFLWFFFK